MTDKTSRISFDEYIMQICHAVAARATCRHRDQGAVIVRNKRIMSTGYNGAPPGVGDCLGRQYCSKEAGYYCLAEGLHGESNAIITAAREGVSVNGTTLYGIYSPCRSCCNILKTAGIAEVVYEEVYDGFPDGPNYLKLLGVEVRRLAKRYATCPKCRNQNMTYDNTCDPIYYCSKCNHTYEQNEIIYAEDTGGSK